MFFAGARVAAAQPVAPPLPPQPLTLDAAIRYAGEHYPALRAAALQVQAADAGVDAARAAYLPRLDGVLQSNRGPANNVFGQLLPQSVIPALSGPVLPAASAQSVWGSAAGALLSWEPFDFGLRGAAVGAAEASLSRARAAEKLGQLDVEAAVANAFLALVEADRGVAAAQADVERRTVLARSVHALVDNQLKPGAEASRADAERAAAGTRLIRAQQAAALSRLALARTLGVAVRDLVIDVRGVADAVPGETGAATAAASAAPAHPLAALRQAAVDEARAQAAILARTDKPRVFLQSSLSSRGTGAAATGDFDGSLRGLALDRVNWAAGVQVTFPNVLDFSSLRARRIAADAVRRAEESRLDEALLMVTTQQEMAAATVAAARAIAANLPIQLAAAREGEAQARARYDAGLSGIVEIAEAQNLLAQTEAQDELARVDVWRALLGEAVARGDLAGFVARLRAPGAR
jgi:outer membrane protein TolC